MEVTCGGAARDALLQSKRQRRGASGECLVQAIHGLRLKQLWIASAAGESWTRADVARWFIDAAKTTVGQVMRIEGEEKGVIRFRPVSTTMPMRSEAAHRFREMCLSMVVNFPELVGRQQEKSILSVDHALEDKHHTFAVTGAEEGRIQHTWGATSKIVPWRPIATRANQAVAAFLEVEEATVDVATHPWLTRMSPLWVGRRRWTQTRKQYKRLISKGQADGRSKARSSIESKLREQNAELAQALHGLQWSKIHRMEGVTAYQTQNICKLKVNRLRLWAGEEVGYQCEVTQCGETHLGGTAHLAWECTEAQQY
jgi:hypothetical protein